ncbi:MAG: AAA family ATPase [Planctomycetes bacterium]|nr:AAA family ATPase [Planctomycetota bacterium]
MVKQNKDEDILKVLLGEELPAAEEDSRLERLLSGDPPKGVLVEMLLRATNQKRKLELGLQEAKKLDQKKSKLIQELTALPWYPAKFVRRCDNMPGKVYVSVGHSEMLVGCANGIRPDELRHSQTVLLSHERNCIVGVDDCPSRFGDIGTVDRVLGEQAILKINEAEEIRVGLSDELRADPPKTGDRVIYDRGLLLALEILPKQEEESSILEDVDSSISFDMIGGLDDVIDQILEDVALHLFHRDLVREHRLRPSKGIILAGPPGVGKTMIGKALGTFLKSQAVTSGEVKFCALPPGSFRSHYYGMTEQRIRQVFRVCRDFSKRKDGNRCILFCDELDTWGRRSADVTNSVDSRVLTCFLSEVDGLDETGNIFLIGATNRADDLVDSALMRPGRFGDNILRIPRPGREAIRDIFGKYLTPDLPFRRNGHRASQAEAAEIAAEIIDAATSRIFRANDDARIATLIMRDGSRRDVHAREIISGAMCENIVRRAKVRSCVRGLAEETGITPADVIEAVDDEVTSAARSLRSPSNARAVLGLSSDNDIVRVEFPSDGAEHIRPHRYVRA